MEELYLKLKLWYWWHLVIKKDEFSQSLSYYNIRKDLMKKYPNLSKCWVDEIVIRQRNLAHLLVQTNYSVWDISPVAIKKSRI